MSVGRGGIGVVSSLAEASELSKVARVWAGFRIQTEISRTCVISVKTYLSSESINVMLV